MDGTTNDGQGKEPETPAEEEKRLQNEIDELKAEAIRTKVSQDTGIPANLLHGDNEDELRAQADAINDYMASLTPQKQLPLVPDPGRQPGVRLEAVVRGSIPQQFAESLFRMKADNMDAHVYEAFYGNAEYHES